MATRIALIETKTGPKKTPKIIPVGGLIEGLSDAEAASLDRAGVVDIPPDEPSALDVDAALAGIARLDPNNPAHWTKSGKPDIAALEQASGITGIDAEARDQLWAVYQDRGAKRG